MPGFGRSGRKGRSPRRSNALSSMDAAARVLALAQETADEAIAEAEAQAATIIAEARQQAAEIIAAARQQASSAETVDSYEPPALYRDPTAEPF